MQHADSPHTSSAPRRRRAWVVTILGLIIMGSLVVTVRSQAAANPKLVVSSTSHTNGTGLDGSTVANNVYIWTQNVRNGSTVKYWLDDASRTGSPMTVDTKQPYDLLTDASNQALPLDTNTLANGKHTLTIQAIRYGAVYNTQTATFTVANSVVPGLDSTLFGDAVPANPSDPDPQAVEVAVRFKTNAAGSVKAIRFYKGTGNTGTHVGSLWLDNGDTGTRLASVTFTNETATGWQTANFPTPIPLTVGQYYRVSYNAPNGHTANDSLWWGQAVDSGPLHANADGEGAGGHNGVYAYGTAGTYPWHTIGATNYWVDLVFTPTASGSPATTSTTSTTTTAPPTTVAPTTTTTAPTTTVAPPPTVQPSILNVPRIPWEGGTAYYSPYAKATLLNNPNFFPIGVWFESMMNASQLKAIGINTFVGANHDGPSVLPNLAANGMAAILQDEWTRSEVGSTANVVGWLAGDECDMNCSDPVGTQSAKVSMFRSYNDGRFVYSNYGKGSIGTWWNADKMPTLVRGVDVASDDLYAYSDPNLPSEAPQSQYWPAGAVVRSSGTYGWTMKRMQSFLDPSNMHPTWNFVEVGHPWTESDALAPTMTPDHAEGAIWASIIHEARGIIYFNHSFGGTCTSQHVLFDCNPAMKTRIAAVDAQIQSLAPVLNSQSYAWTASPNADTMLKTYNGSAYLFAGIGHNQSTGTKTFTLPSGVTGTTVTVIGENRTIPVVNGTFSDTFAAEYTHHSYQITL